MTIDPSATGPFAQYRAVAYANGAYGEVLATSADMGHAMSAASDAVLYRIHPAAIVQGSHDGEAWHDQFHYGDWEHRPADF